MIWRRSKWACSFRITHLSRAATGRAGLLKYTCTCDAFTFAVHVVCERNVATIAWESSMFPIPSILRSHRKTDVKPDGSQRTSVRLVWNSAFSNKNSEGLIPTLITRFCLSTIWKIWIIKFINKMLPFFIYDSDWNILILFLPTDFINILRYRVHILHIFLIV